MAPRGCSTSRAATTCSHDLPWRRRRYVPPRLARSRCRASRTTPCRSDLSAHASWQRNPPRASRTTGCFMTRAIAMRCAQRLGSIAMRLSLRGGFRGSRTRRSAEECKSRGFGGRRGPAGEGEGGGGSSRGCGSRSETEKQSDRRTCHRTFSPRRLRTDACGGGNTCSAAALTVTRSC